MHAHAARTHMPTHTRARLRTSTHIRACPCMPKVAHASPHIYVLCMLMPFARPCTSAHARARPGMSLYDLGCPHTLIYAMHAHTGPGTSAHTRACPCMIFVAHINLCTPCMPMHANSCRRTPTHAHARPYMSAHIFTTLITHMNSQHKREIKEKSKNVLKIRNS